MNGGGPVGRLSWSQVSRFNDCSEKYHLRYREKAPSIGSGAAMAGSSIHTAIQMAEEEGWWERPLSDGLHPGIIQAFVVAFGVELAGGKWWDQADPEKGLPAGWRWDPPKIKCPERCNEGRVPEPCPACGGSGQGGEVTMFGGAPCGTCDGDGVVAGPCARCEGSGYLYGAEAVRWGGRKSKEYPDGEGLLWWCFNGPLMLKRYVAVRQADQEGHLRVVQGNVERQVNVLHRIEGRAEPLHVMGYLDAVVLVDPDGEAIIRDYKTGTWMEPLQLAFYAWLLAHDEDRGLTATRGQFVKLKPGQTDKRVVEYDLAAWVPLVPRIIEGSLKGIESGLHYPEPSNMCGTCDVRLSCPWGITLSPEEAA